MPTSTNHGNTEPVYGGCQSCTHWVSSAEARPEGVCSHPGSVAAFDTTMADDTCSLHDPWQVGGDLHGMLLCERKCRVCGNVAVYSAGSWGTDWCVYDH